MRIANYLSLICLSVLFLGFIACDDDKEQTPDVLLEACKLTIFEEIGIVQIHDGTPPYQLVIEDLSILTAEVEIDRQVVITPKKAGITNLLLTDANKKKATLEVTIPQTEYDYEFTGLFNRIEIEDKTIQMAIEEELTQEEIPFTIGGGLLFYYQSFSNGIWTSYSDTKEKLNEGTFTIDMLSGKSLELSNTQNKKITYLIGSYKLPPTKSTDIHAESLTPSKELNKFILSENLALYEDWTAVYKEKYPDTDFEEYSVMRQLRFLLKK